MLAHVLHRGDVFAGRYRVERCIGSGGMGAVFEAEHLETERRVALKVLHPQSLNSETARERFKQEARVAGKLRHLHIVDVLDAGVDDITSMPYLVMELLHGEDLGSRIGRVGPMHATEAVRFMQQIGDALDCLHERQIVHRDLKPENLFLTWGDDGTPILKLLDFGVAKVIADGKTSALTQDAQGTPVYMAPEQFAEQIRISPATDIYALGLLAFTLLTGHQYWGAEIARGMNVFMLARIAEAGPKERATLRAERVGIALPAAFDEWFSTVTAIVPGERFPTATVAVEVLAEVLGVPLVEEPAPSSRRVSSLMRPPVSTATQAPLSSGAPVVDRAPRADEPGGTPPIHLHRRLPFWRRPSMMTGALMTVAGAIAIAASLVRTPPSFDSPPSTAASPPATAVSPPASAAASAPASTPSSADSSTASSALSGAPEPSSPASAEPTVPTASAASSGVPASSAVPVAPTNAFAPTNAAVPTSTSSAAPAASSATPPRHGSLHGPVPSASGKKPKYTRD